MMRRSWPTMTIAGIALCAVALCEDAWVPVPTGEGDLALGDVDSWRPYREARTSEIATPDGKPALRVNVSDEKYGGLRLEASPRGGYGNRMRFSLQYRIVEGAPVTVWAGPNTWNQAAGRLVSSEWETAIMEVGLLSDCPLVLHVAQPGPSGVFELGDLQVQTQGAAGDVRRALGPVDVAVDCQCADSTAAFAVKGELTAEREDRPEGGPVYRVQASGGEAGAWLMQQTGALPAGTALRLQAECRVLTGGPATLGMGRGDASEVRAEVAAEEWTAIAIDWVLPWDGTPSWVMGAAPGVETEFEAHDVEVLVTLPGSTGPGVLPVAKGRRPITLATGDAKSIYITPPWEWAQRILCHLEYNNRWNFRVPDTYTQELSKTGDRLDLTWGFAGDPVTYQTIMTVDGPDSLLVEVRLTNAGEEVTEAFRPGFCLQIGGAAMPKTFAYTVIPRERQPLQMSAGTQFAPTAEPWPGYGWVKAHYTGSKAYEQRVAQGEAFEPEPRYISETGDFPLLARRVPGRNAWIGWIWPTAAGYFGNTMTPCMHMDPMLPQCPAGESISMFGRMVFFEGTWDELYSYAQTERDALAATSAW